MKGDTEDYNLLAADLQHNTDRNVALSPSRRDILLQDNFNLVGDSVQVHKAIVCRAVRAVALSLCQHFNDYVKFPTQPEQRNMTRQKLYQIAGFPNILGCGDGTYIRIKGPKDKEL